MTTDRRLVWHVKGTVTETSYNVGKKNRPYWQVIVEVEGGYLCLYIRSDEMRKTAERLASGCLIEASGVARPSREIAGAKGPVWLDPVDQLRELDV